MQTGLNVTEIDVRPYYAIDRVNWLGFSDSYVPLYATKEDKPKRPNSTEEALKHGSFFYEYTCYTILQTNLHTGIMPIYI